MRINTDYLGGDPDYPAGIKGGTLTVSKGGLLFGARNAETAGIAGIAGLGAGTEPLLNYPARDLRGVSFADPVEDSAATIARTAKGAALGLALGGNAQGAAAGAYLASRMGNHNPILYVACQQRGQMFIASFTIKATKVNEFFAELQGQREKVGLARLPSVESLVDDGPSSPSAIGPTELAMPPRADSPVEAVPNPGSYGEALEATRAALDAMGHHPIHAVDNFITVDEQTIVEVHETYLIVRVLPLIDATPEEIMGRADVGTGPARFEVEEGVVFSTVRLPLPPDPSQKVGPITYFVMAAILSATKLAAGRTEAPLG